MSVLSSTFAERGGDSFRHEALLYAGDEGFLAGTVPFVREAVAAAEPVMVVISERKIALLRDALGPDADAARFADMSAVGRNPARIIPAWQQFVDEHRGDGRRLWGIGEPVGPARRGPELAECARHEALLNVAFDGSPGWSLLCPYDTAALDPAVVAQAHRTHPIVRNGDGPVPSDRYQPGLEAVREPLPDPPPDAVERPFDDGPLEPLRAFVAAHARAAGVGDEAAGDLVLAVNELATNSLRYGGGGGTLRVWTDPEGLVCEVRDAGCVDQPLVGRERPAADGVQGRGLWLVNQLCDLVALRSSPGGTVVRLHTWIA